MNTQISSFLKCPRGSIISNQNRIQRDILKTNLAINLSTTEYEFYVVSLGKEEGVFTLRLPSDNFGGAYVEDGNLQFDGETPARHSN